MKKWYNKDKAILTSCLLAYKKKGDAFAAASRKTGRTVASVRSYYYSNVHKGRFSPRQNAAKKDNSRKHKRYNQHEINVMVGMFERYFYNLKYAAKSAAKELGRTANSILQYYYTTLRHQEVIGRLDVNGAYLINVKNVHRPEDAQKFRSLV